MTSVLVLKTGALGDVLRTTSILPGLAGRFEDLRVTWFTAHAAVPLVERHPLVERVVACDPTDAAAVDAAGRELGGGAWDWVLSLDDEEPLCALASSLDARRVAGAILADDGARTYTDDVEEWFGMGLLSKDGKEAADARKRENERTHPAILASMLGIEPGRPALPLSEDAIERGRALAAANGLDGDALVVGLNTGAGGRWTSKGLPVERVVAFAGAFAAAVEREVRYVILGGPAERERNARSLAGIEALGGRTIDAGADNSLTDFAAIVGTCDLLLTSDSLALHVGVAMETPIVAFFAPTSAAEIELYGLGQKVVSTAPDYCSYARDADRSTLTVERLVDAALRVLAARS